MRNGARRITRTSGVGVAVLVAAGCILPGRGQVVDVGAPPSSKRKQHEEAEGAAALVREPPARSEARYCRTLRPVVRELRGLTSRHIRCVSERYVQAGYFGDLGDLASHSFRRSCFSSDPALEQTLHFQERSLPNLQTTLSGRMRIGVDGQIDLSRFGFDPDRYVFEDHHGVTSAYIVVSFFDVSVRSPTNLGQALGAVESNPRVPEGQRAAAASCRRHLCEPQAMYTAEIVSARVRAEVTLEGGEARALRSSTVLGNAVISGSGSRFTIEPVERINLVARFRASQEALVGANACGTEPQQILQPRPQAHTRCSSEERGGVRVTYEGCVANSSAVQCYFILRSFDTDQRLRIDASRGPSLFDDRGAGHRPTTIAVGDNWLGSLAEFSLVAKTATNVTLQFDQLPAGLTRSPRVRLSFQTGEVHDFDFRQVEILEELPPACGESSR